MRIRISARWIEAYPVLMMRKCDSPFKKGGKGDFFLQIQTLFQYVQSSEYTYKLIYFVNLD